MKKEEKFLKTSDLTSLHTICEDFSNYLLHREKVEKELIENPNFQSGIHFGIRSAIILFNDFLIENDGRLNRESIEKILSSVQKRQKDLKTHTL